MCLKTSIGETVTLQYQTTARTAVGLVAVLLQVPSVGSMTTVGQTAAVVFVDNQPGCSRSKQTPPTLPYWATQIMQLGKMPVTRKILQLKYFLKTEISANNVFRVLGGVYEP